MNNKLATAIKLNFCFNYSLKMKLNYPLEIVDCAIQLGLSKQQLVDYIEEEGMENFFYTQPDSGDGYYAVKVESGFECYNQEHGCVNSKILLPSSDEAISNFLGGNPNRSRNQKGRDRLERKLNIVYSLYPHLRAEVSRLGALEFTAQLGLSIKDLLEYVKEEGFHQFAYLQEGSTDGFYAIMCDEGVQCYWIKRGSRQGFKKVPCMDEAIFYYVESQT